MKYFSERFHDGKQEELTADEVRFCLEGAYKPEFVDWLLAKGAGFRFRTPYRELWTKTDDGMVLMAGFYGYSCEEDYPEES